MNTLTPEQLESLRLVEQSWVKLQCQEVTLHIETFRTLLAAAEQWPYLQAENLRLLTLQARYYELLFAVARKYKNETRHQTALRYIREWENLLEKGHRPDAPTPGGPRDNSQ